MAGEYQTLTLTSAAQWRAWLAEHHADTDGVWLRFYKKSSGLAAFTKDAALDEALCFGWIDSQGKRFDDQSYVQKFTPRKKSSLWSKLNIEHVARLTEAGCMMPAGLAEVDRAKADGRWQAAYDKPSEMTLPDEFLTELEKHPKAKSFLMTLNKTNAYAIAWRLRTSKTEKTRLARQEKLIRMLNAGEKLH